MSHPTAMLADKITLSGRYTNADCQKADGLISIDIKPLNQQNFNYFKRR
jgi:hypothetical protein